MPNSAALVRSYLPSDLPQIKALHEKSGIDYCLPDLDSPLFLIKKVVEVDGRVIAAGGLRIEAELYLWLDHEYGLPEERLLAVQALDKAGMEEAWLKGIDNCVLWLPPGMERFGERLEKTLGFTRDRAGWMSYSKSTETT